MAFKSSKNKVCFVYERSVIAGEAPQVISSYSKYRLIFKNVHVPQQLQTQGGDPFSSHVQTFCDQHFQHFSLTYQSRCAHKFSHYCIKLYMRKHYCETLYLDARYKCMAFLFHLLSAAVEERRVQFFCSTAHAQWSHH